MSNYNDDYGSYEKIKKEATNKHAQILDELSEIEDISFETYNEEKPAMEDESFLPSEYLRPQKKKKSKKKKKGWFNPEEWFDDLAAQTDSNFNVKAKYRQGIFDEDGSINKKRKKKKKDKNGDIIDYKKEFEPELALYKNLLVSQNKFTDALQKEYDQIKAVKSSARGVNKQMTDLMESITHARTLSMQLVEKNVNAKKLISELTMKQKKELGLSNNGEFENMADFANSYIQQIINERSNINGVSEPGVISDMTDDEMFSDVESALFDNLEIDNEVGESDTYLKYENVGAKIYVVIGKDGEGNEDIVNYRFVAKDENNNILHDYPEPIHTKITVNRSTNMAQDAYGEKYPIIWVDENIRDM